MAAIPAGRKKLRKPQKVAKPRLQKLVANETNVEVGLLTWLYWIATWIVYILLFVLYLSLAKALPHPASQRSFSNIYQFRESKAKQYLTNLTSYGPHFVGSVQNEYYIPVFIVDVLKTIEEKSRGINALTLDTDRTTGSYFATYGGGFVNYYENINTIIAKFGPKNDTDAPSILVTCNYDSGPNSPGTAYNAVSCSCLLEVIDIFSRVDILFTKNIIFLFSGGDEIVVQAKHGFMKNHPWASSVKAFVNLESCGAGGWEVLVAAGLKHPWIVKIYSKITPYSFGTLIGASLVKNGITPINNMHKILSDQDGLDIPGIQIAHTGLGHVAHTFDDLIGNIRDGALQKCGNSIMNLLRGLLKSPFLVPNQSYSENINRTYLRGKQVTIDILGTYLLSMPGRMARMIGISIAAVVLVHVAFRMFVNYCEGDAKNLNLVYVCSLAIGAEWFLVTLFIALLSIGLDMLGYTMTWYSTSWLLVPLYIAPTATIIFVLHGYVKHFFLMAEDPWLLERTFYDLHLGLFSFIVLFLVWCKSTVMPYFVIWEMFAFVARIFVDAIIKAPKEHPNLWAWLCFLHSSTFPACIFLNSVFITCSYMWPLMGQTGSEVAPDYMAAFICAGCTLVCFSFQVGHIYLTKHVYDLVRAIAPIFFGAVVFITFSSVGFPYSSEGGRFNKQRHFIQHINRVVHSASGNIIKQDSGILHIPLDRNGIQLLRPLIPELSTQRPVRCEKGPYCGWPYHLPLAESHRKTYYLPAERPHVRAPYAPVFKLFRKEVVHYGQRLHFNVSGTSHMNVYISPRTTAHLTSWSFTPGKPQANSLNTGDGRLHYFIYYSYGIRPKDTWKFWLELKVSPQHPAGEPIVDVSFACHHFSMNGEPIVTGDLQRYTNLFPPWTTVIPWITHYQTFMY